MHFCDETKVELIAGAGGKGSASFRREKFIPKGGPDGGDGGKGGSLVLKVDENINTLSEFETYKIFRADAGEAGRGQRQHGKNAEDLVLKVPPGTLVYDEGKKHVIADLREKNQEYVAAAGGRGGFGNAHFATATRQTPTFAELGEPGEKKTVVLELKLISDVGIIGLPSVGKSSLIARVSSAKPKIADYPFTTIVPNLGVVSLSSFGADATDSMVVCDLPGLIKGAHLGKGLGIQFLKHISRNRVLLHVLDASRETIQKDYKEIREEIIKFDPELGKKPEIIAINKIDLLDEKARKNLQNKFKKAHLISCATGEGLGKLMLTVWNELKKIPKEIPEKEPDEEYKVYRPADQDQKSFSIKLIGTKGGKQVFEVIGKRIGQIAVMTEITHPEARERLYDVLKKMHIDKELRRKGAVEGDIVIIRGKEITFHEV